MHIHMIIVSHLEPLPCIIQLQRTYEARDSSAEVGNLPQHICLCFGVHVVWYTTQRGKSLRSGRKKKTNKQGGGAGRRERGLQWLCVHGTTLESWLKNRVTLTKTFKTRTMHLSR